MEIKIRALLADLPKWLYGVGVADYIHSVFPEDGYSWLFVPPPQVGSGWHKVFRESVGVFTGLKDKNGVEIYGGDILKCTRKDMDYSDTIAVKYTPGQFVAYNPNCCEVCKSGDGCIEYLSDRVFFEQLWDVEVIGNIHFNPELLK